MRSVTIAVLVCALTSIPAFPEDTQDTQPSTVHVVKRAFGPMAFVRSAMGALIGQWKGTPEEWGGGMKGYGRRFASGFGGHLVKVGIQYPVARVMHEEFGYTRSNKQGFKARLIYALEATIITHKTTTEKKTLSTSEIAGNFGAGFISRLWQPASTRAISSGFTSAGIGFAADAGGNVVREFWPEIRHPHSHAKALPAVAAPQTSSISPQPSAELAPVE